MSQSTLLDLPSPTVALYEDRPATTSLEVAKFFNKRHDHVVRDIRSLIDNCPESFRAPNFGETFRTVDGPNGATREEVYFILYRDGFMLLVMGYTGKKAMQIKIAYIEAFNALEAELTKKATHRGRKALPNALPENRTSSREAELIAEIAYLKGTLGLIEKVARTCETKSQVMWSMIITYSQDTKPGESEWMKILQA